MSDSIISACAYSKIFFHAAKYPFQPVWGVIIGVLESDKMEVHDVLPVSHNPPAGPLFDLSIELGKCFDSNRGPIGIYFSNDKSDNDSTPVYVISMSKGIQSILGSCLVIQLKNSLISDSSQLCVTSSYNGKNIQFAVPGHTAESANNMVDALMARNAHRCLVDLEDHMAAETASPESDFRNGSINAMVTASGK